MRDRSRPGGRRLDVIQQMHASTKRDYVGRVTEFDKATAAELAQRWDVEYWDADRKTGYGGYKYDGRWRPVAERLAHEYGLRAGDRILDVGCGKGFLLYEFTQAVPGIEISGLDISGYAIDHAKEEVRSRLTVGNASRLPFADRSFDFVVSLATLHNLQIAALWDALHEINRVTNGERGYLMVESFRNEREKANLLYWQLTCRSFYAVEDWEWIFAQTDYRGDYGFIFFE
ncbi:MAG TPA: class I SAM-dependent methyltransferase [Candidatus Binatia bacterium]|nr:class I SAM-dependent methyltransferase [Candidatus Binatia bacterium]